MPTQKIPILMYHSISHSTNPKFAEFAVPPVRFAEQMEYLHTHGYTPMTVTQLVQSAIELLPEKPVVLTFDDGMSDFFTETLPVLTRYSFPATLYIATSFVASTCDWLRRDGESNRRTVTWEQLTQIQAAGIECGAHSHTHPQLDVLSFTQAQQEIITSKKMLEDHLGQSVTSFAYPYGYYTTDTQHLVHMAGYTSACAVAHAMHTVGTNVFALPRLMVNASMSREEFADLLIGNGLYYSTLSTAYKRMRTSVWRMVRRSSVYRHFVETDTAQHSNPIWSEQEQPLPSSIPESDLGDASAAQKEAYEVTSNRRSVPPHQQRRF